MFKIIGLGTSDAISVKILDRIKDDIQKISDKIKIICEVEEIKKEDKIIIIDCSSLGYHPNTVTMYKLNTENSDLYAFDDKKYDIYVILVEIAEDDLENKQFLDLCIDVFHLIKKIIEENEDED